MGIFENALYPDNNKRLDRLLQLSQDCNDLSGSLADDKEQIEFELKNANDTIANAYKKFVQNEVKYSSIQIDPNWAIQATEIISPIFIANFAVKGMNTAMRAYMLRQGRIAEAAFAEAIGFPKWFKFARVGVGVGVMFGAELIIDAVSGAEQRDKLQNGIHSLISPRIKLKQAKMINTEILTTLKTVNAAYRSVSIPSLKLTADQLNSLAETMVNDYKININSYTEDNVRNELADYDKKRNAWTNED